MRLNGDFETAIFHVSERKRERAIGTIVSAMFPINGTGTKVNASKGLETKYNTYRDEEPKNFRLAFSK